MKRLILIGTTAALVAVAATVAVVAAPIATAALPGVQKVVDTTFRAAYGKGHYTLKCVNERQLRSLSGSSRALGGLAEPATDRVWIDSRLCWSVANWFLFEKLNSRTIQGLVTIGHEAAHLRGVRVESKAECAGVNFAYRWMKQWRTFDEYDERTITRTLVSNEGRPPAYRLQACALAFGID